MNYVACFLSNMKTPRMTGTTSTAYAVAAAAAGIVAAAAAGIVAAAAAGIVAASAAGIVAASAAGIAVAAADLVNTDRSNDNDDTPRRSKSGNLYLTFRLCIF